MSDYDDWAERSREPDMPLPPPEDERDAPILDVPVCPLCGRMVSRHMDESYRSVFTCDLHGQIHPNWEKV